MENIKHEMKNISIRCFQKSVIQIAIKFLDTEAVTGGVYTKGARRNFAKVTRKHLCQNLFFKGCLPQILFGPFLNILSQLILSVSH